MSEREAANDRLCLYMTAVCCLVVEQVQARGCGAQSIAQIQWTLDQKSPPAQQPCVPNAKGSKISFCKDCRVHDRRYMSGATHEYRCASSCEHRTHMPPKVCMHCTTAGMQGHQATAQHVFCHHTMHTTCLTHHNGTTLKKQPMLSCCLHRPTKFSH